MRIFREVSLADSISVLNALFGFSALIYAIYDYEKSFAFFYFALISDGLDGWIAEKTEKSRLGKELDALADCVSFSVYPAFLVSLVNPDLFFLSSLMLSFAILRLARFNVLNLRDFLGIPTSVNAIMVTSLVRLKASQEVLAILMLIFSILMISDLEYKRIRGASLIFFGVLLILAVFFIEVCYLLIAISLIYAALPGVSVCGRYLLAFEAGIKLGALFHQFIGAPVSEENAEILEKAMESCLRLQPYVVDAEVKIDREKLRLSSFGYTSLSPEALRARVVVEFEGERVEAVLEWNEELKYPLMKLRNI